MMESSRGNDIRTHDTAPREPRDAAADIPLVTRVPALASVPRQHFGAFPTPIIQVALPGARDEFWIKRDDLNARALAGSEAAGGNKLRALEFLLADVEPGDTVLALGGGGSTHVLATVLLSRRLGARTIAIRWPHDMNPVAHLVAARVDALADERVRARTVAGALARAWWLARGPRVHRVPPGGTSALGMLGAVNAGLELAEQVASGATQAPARVVLPLGTGGTAAGLAVGFALAGLATRVVGVRVTPRIVSNGWRVRRLARRCAAFVAQLAGRPRPDPVAPIDALHAWYGGAYGRALPRARAATDELERIAGLALDETYGAKAFAAAAELARTQPGPTLFWRTFDPASLGRAEPVTRG